MKTLTALATAATLSFAGTAAIAAGPVQMTDDQLDAVVAGQPRPFQEGLVNVNVQDVTILENVIVNIPVNAAVAIGVLTGDSVGAGAVQRPGRVAIN
jgi:hypothetical protein